MTTAPLPETKHTQHKARGGMYGLSIGAAITAILAWIVEEAWGLDIGPIEGAVALLINGLAIYAGIYYAPANQPKPVRSRGGVTS